MKIFMAPALLLVISLCACPWVLGQGFPAGFDYFAEFGPSCLHGPVQSGASGMVKCEAGRLFTGARLRLTRHDAVEASYSWSPDIFNEEFPLSYFNDRIRSHSFNYVRYASAIPHLQPFGTVGIGWMTFSGGGNGGPGPGSLASITDSSFAWNYGAGIDLVPFRYFAVRVELRDYLTTLPVYHSSGLHNFTPSLGIVFRWNRNPKL